MKRNFYTTHFRASRLFLLALLLFAGAAQAQVFVNGNFEDWSGTCPTNTAPTGWTNYSTALAPDEAGTTCIGNVVAHQGDSYMNLVWINSGLQEGASQAVTGLTIGTVYRISFWAINSQGVYADPGDCILQVHRNSVNVFATSNLVTGGAWTYYSVDFTAAAPFETIAFRNTPGSSGTSGSVGVDEFSVAEPVGIRDDMMHQLSVYPNPTTDKVHVRQGDYLIDNLGQIPFTVSNLMGQEIHASIADFTTGDAQLDLPTLESGVYYLNLMINGEKVVRKFVMN